MYGHFTVYESLNRCTHARFCCRLKVGSSISAFRFPLSVAIVNLKNTTPSGDIPREHYRQHCQYRLRGGAKVYCAWPGIEHNKGKRTMPSGDIQREHYQQHCQYRVRGLRYIARGLASSIIKGNVRRHLVISHASIIDNIVNTGYGA